MRPALRLLLMCSVLVLAGCSAYRDLRDCGWRGCPGDQQITTEVQQLINQHTELLPPNHVYVQTLKHVVYLTGSVATDLQRQIAQSIAANVKGVHRVVNTIALPYEGR
jgi:osmotically-inducible protein OsmY